MSLVHIVGEVSDLQSSVKCSNKEELLSKGRQSFPSSYRYAARGQKNMMIITVLFCQTVSNIKGIGQSATTFTVRYVYTTNLRTINNKQQQQPLWKYRSHGGRLSVNRKNTAVRGHAASGQNGIAAGRSAACKEPPSSACLQFSRLIRQIIGIEIPIVVDEDLR